MIHFHTDSSHACTSGSQRALQLPDRTDHIVDPYKPRLDRRAFLWTDDSPRGDEQVSANSRLSRNVTNNELWRFVTEILHVSEDVFADIALECLWDALERVPGHDGGNAVGFAAIGAGGKFNNLPVLESKRRPIFRHTRYM